MYLGVGDASLRHECTDAALSLLGAGLPKHTVGTHASNETGYWEPERLVALHDVMLAEAGSRWDY
jgi:hypothetical protein